MRIRVLNRFWNLRFAPNLAHRADYDPPDERGKEIRVSSTLKGEEKLEVIVHELVHAAGWHIDEKFAERFAGDAARVLWRLGYRESS